MKRIGIAGAGAWGTALAATACRAGRDTVLWARRGAVAEAITERHENFAYLPGVPLDPAIRVTTDLAAMAAADAVLLAVPAQHLRGLCARLAPGWRAGTPVVICAKGIEQGTGALMSEVVAETLPKAPIAVLSGPTFAAEVARNLPTAVTLAGAKSEVLARALGSSTFRIYTSRDCVGAQVGGAVKNVLAIACGIVAGRSLGDNARAALITRGLAEIVRLGAAKGARMETLMGLSGIGDLTLTGTNMVSRNYSLGVDLGRGEVLAAILAARRSVAEGVHSAVSVVALADRLGIEMPICRAVDGILNRGADIEPTIAGLLSRRPGPEVPFPGLDNNATRST